MATDKKTKAQDSTTPYLPEELIIKILVRLPAKVLHRSMKLVCKQWACIICDPLFIEAHLCQSKTGLFIGSVGSSCHAHFLEIKCGEFRVTDLRVRFPGRMVASCDGVSLFNDPNSHRSFYVANPATLQVTTLPHLDVPPNPLYYSSCIARIPSTGKFKVVHSYKDLHLEYHWLVLTVGIDNSWRKINCQQAFGNDEIELDCFPVSVAGVIYWTDYDFQLNGINYFLAMDMEDETIVKVPIPSGCAEPCVYLQMGDFLSCFTTNLPTSQFDILVLKDLQKGEWVKVYEIGMEVGRDVPQDLFFVLPLGWLNNDEVLVLEALTFQGDLHLAYDVKKKETRVVDLSVCGSNFLPHIHIDSLISWMT
ncbi:hypothetical protein F0562_032090 [Nyssa sinensis]|uniref:Uncharacterized protein n=1 Tax=Nyssa sinensis TaxID=561372 RepID=A0A5J5AUJ5_9ASTE|nr:hypothetical protein F0562_032090 [Nyssa sinensis]